jgi:hypothetical protein
MCSNYLFIFNFFNSDTWKKRVGGQKGAAFIFTFSVVIPGGKKKKKDVKRGV